MYEYSPCIQFYIRKYIFKIERDASGASGVCLEFALLFYQSDNSAAYSSSGAAVDASSADRFHSFSSAAARRATRADADA